ncbi:MAG: LamG-like jellyroll fold domain-containing protein [Bacteroidota bacterium]
MKKIALSLMFLAIIGLTFAQSGQIFYYPFNNGNTDNQAATSFSTLFAQSTNATTDALGNDNSALNFNGSGAELWVNSSGLIDFGLTTNFTFLTNFKSGSAATQYFFRDLLTNGNGWHIGILNSTGHITFEAGDGPGDDVSIRTENIYNDNEWHHLTLLVDKSNMTIQMYIDGELQNLVASICGNSLTDTSINIDGCNFNANEDNPNLTALGDNLLGALDEIKLYSSLLTDEEIQECYASSFIETPLLSSPFDGSIFIDPMNANLTWQGVNGALTYQIEIDVNPSFGLPAIETSSIPSLNIDYLDPMTTYYWRVRAETDNGLSNYSQTWSFTTLNQLNDGPTLSSPLDNATEVNPISVDLVWNDLTGAENYELEIDSDASFPTPSVLPAASSSLTLSNLSENTLYFWRVKAFNSLGESPYSATWSFTTTAPLNQAPNLISPANGASGLPTASVPLTWESIAGAEDYSLEFDVSNAFLSPTVQNTIGTSDNAEGLLPSTTYYWRVRGNNAVGSSPYSEVWSFTTDDMTGVQELGDVGISAFPNPVLNILQMDHYFLNTVYQVYDSNGKQIESKNLNGNTIDLSSLKKGVYHLIISSEDEKLLTYTFVKR